MRNFFFWILFYTLVMAFSQILLKIGTTQIGGFVVKEFKDIIFMAFKVLINPPIMLAIALMVSCFFLWIFILSWAKLGLVFPLTALTYVFVAVMSFSLLGERLSIYNYFGVFLIVLGVFFLLYR